MRLACWVRTSLISGVPVDMAVVLDSGCLIAIDNNDRKVLALLRVAQTERIPVRTSAGVIAQSWRDGARQAILARLLSGTTIAAIDASVGRRIGNSWHATELPASVMGHVALLANRGDTVITSDKGDIARLLATCGVQANIIEV